MCEIYFTNFNYFLNPNKLKFVANENCLKYINNVFYQENI